MAVREERPAARLDAAVDHAQGHGLLALAEGAVLHRHADLVGQLHDLRRRVDARREHEDERRVDRRGLVDDLQVECGRVGVGLAEVLRHEARGGEEHAVGAERAQDAHALQLVRALVFPVARQRLGLGLRRHIPVLPVARALVERRRDAHELRHLVELGDVVPRVGVDPVGARVLPLVGAVDYDTAEAEEVELGLLDLVVTLHDARAELEREEQLVALEEAAARVVVDSERVVIVDHLAALGHRDLLRAAARVDREVEEVDVGIERELVHRVDACHVIEHKVGDRRADRGRRVLDARLVDDELLLLRDLELLVHLLGRDLGNLEGLHQVVVVEQRARGLRKELEDLVLEVDELLLARGHLDHELGLLLLERRFLLLHDGREQLRLEALLLHREVDDRGLRRDLGRVVRVAHLGGDVEAEVLVVVELLVAQLEHAAVADLHDRLGQHRLERRVELLEYVLKQHGRTELDRVLDGSEHVFHLQVDDL
mmetsp:Transcript_24325/g.56057  ORF Transcript_24325/g.56057 Transcript_24325/m.56057 type:complete len:485 (+) Transcript_24325:1672-3126(+)